MHQSDDLPLKEETAMPLGDPKRGLSFKLLLMTILFVMFADILIYFPLISNFQKDEIEKRLRTGVIAAHALTAYPEAPPRDIQADMLSQVDAYAIAVRTDGMKQMVAVADTPPTVDRSIDVRQTSFLDLLSEATNTLLLGDDRTIKATGAYGADGEIEIAFSERGLRRAMIEASGTIFLISLTISAITGMLVYYSIRFLFVQPMRKLGIQLERWSHDPEATAYHVIPSGRTDELGHAELAIASIQRRIGDMFKQQRRLADLGLAVSKINHDLRNLLASAQLVSDRLTSIPDPTVQRFAPKLVSTIDRAITYCQSVLAYGKAQEAPPNRRLVALVRLANDVADVTGISHHASIEWVNAVPDSLEVDADSDQLFRVLLNLTRNSVQALEQTADSAMVKRMTISGSREGSVVRIRVADTGPGLPEKTRETLFKPFQGSVRPGGTGLGLAIAAELIRAHGGTIVALENQPGATFEIEIPDRSASLADARSRKTG
ncbi:ATP-binding protein [Oryzibacter oryziterrae]|uniref:ATP-binding protein n=1 Tax=Oryzibacter oryziterrae TaxID=2766474 RepID=UPI001F3A9CC2|nr:HAMP domain-containing sensor histidine kinase [Oryzibacter oryziterrae]